jgi:hypothetical protein
MITIAAIVARIVIRPCGSEPGGGVALGWRDEGLSVTTGSASTAVVSSGVRAGSAAGGSECGRSAVIGRILSSLLDGGIFFNFASEIETEATCYLRVGRRGILIRDSRTWRKWRGWGTHAGVRFGTRSGRPFVGRAIRNV